MKRYVVGLIVTLTIAGFWAYVGPDGLAKAQSGCASQGAVSPTETALAADCEILLDVRDTLAGTATLNWAANTPVEDWDGVHVEGTPLRVVEIGLGDSGLTGTIPSELGSLSNLTFISLGENELTGVIPKELGDLSSLEELWLDQNDLSGRIPRQLGNLSKLRGLFLYSNRLNGPIPRELGDLSNLTSLNLSDNELNGPIPRELGDLSSLTELNLNDNQLSGEIPRSFTSLTSLTSFYFSDNAGLCAPTDNAFQAWLQGIEEVEGYNCPSAEAVADRAVLVRLYNATDGANWSDSTSWLSDRPMREWYGVETDDEGRVSGLYLGGNQLNGPIPPQLGDLANLTELSLTRNQLSGKIPTELGGLANLTVMSLSANRLSGEIPTELGDLSNLTRLYLWGNQLTGEIPDSLTGLTSLENFAFFSNSGLCAPIDNAFQTWLEGIGSVDGSSCAPQDSQEDRAVLAELYSATDGANWEDSSNWLSDRPVREWYGVTNDANGRVIGLYLWKNQLAGSIPPELAGLSNLTYLNLWENQLTGSIPPELGNLSNLTYLNLRDNWLSGSIPPELGNLSNLIGLYLSDNQLTGCIPEALRDVEFNDFDEVGLPFCEPQSPGAPTVSAATAGTPMVRINSPIPVTVTFSEPVNGFTVSDIRVVNGSAVNFVGSDGDSVYTFDVTPNAVGVVTVDIAADVATDADGEGNTAAAQLSLGLPYDDDGDGAIGGSEVLEAVRDYFAGRLTGQQVLAVVRLYFQ